MGEIKISLEDSMRILNNDHSTPNARVIAACAVAFFEIENAGDGINSSSRTIAHKLFRMSASALDDARESDHG